MIDRRLLGGRYQLLDPLGDGGMARVFRARDERLGRIVAVKLLHQRYVGQPGFRERFEKEARLIAALSHPHIVVVHDFGHDSDAYYIVMEYVDGGSLRDLLTRVGPLPFERVRRITRQLAQALDATHARGIIHRDIKPDNILLGADDQVKISDFGIARDLDQPRQTATGMLLGSACYLSPEQAQGRAATAASDIYSTGIVLYEMLSGSPPFMAESAVATALCHVTQEPPPLTQRVPSLPPAAGAAVLRALSKDPDRRFPSASALSTALNAAPLPKTGAAPGVPSLDTGQPGSPSTGSSAPTQPMSQSSGRARSRGRRSLLVVPLIGLVGAAVAYYALQPAPLGRSTAGRPLVISGAGRLPPQLIRPTASATARRLAGGGGPAVPPVLSPTATATAQTTATSTWVVIVPTSTPTATLLVATVPPPSATALPPSPIPPAEPIADQPGSDHPRHAHRHRHDHGGGDHGDQ